MHSGTCRDLASHGYLVFSIDHEDGTSSYTVSKDGKKEIFYENRHRLYDTEVRKGQIQIRVSEVKALIDEMVEDRGARLLSRLGFKSQINVDLDRLIISGHSFGGMTAI
jgi:predicted dienelactone hydrolase